MIMEMSRFGQRRMYLSEFLAADKEHPTFSARPYGPDINIFFHFAQTMRLFISRRALA